MTTCLPRLTFNFPESSSPLLSTGALMNTTEQHYIEHMADPISITSESYVTTRERATHALRLHAGVNTPQDRKLPKPYSNIYSLPDYILYLGSSLWLLGNRRTDTTHFSSRYNLHTKLCPITGQTLLATSRLLWPSFKLVCTVHDKLLGASLQLSFQTEFSLFVPSLL